MNLRKDVIAAVENRTFNTRRSEAEHNRNNTTRFIFTGRLISVTVETFPLPRTGEKKPAITVRYLHNDQIDSFTVVDCEPYSNTEQVYTLLSSVIDSVKDTDNGVLFTFTCGFDSRYLGHYPGTFGHVVAGIDPPQLEDIDIVDQIAYPPVTVKFSILPDMILELIDHQPEIVWGRNLLFNRQGQNIQITGADDSFVDAVSTTASLAYLDEELDVVVIGQIAPSGPWSSTMINGRLLDGYEVIVDDIDQ